MKSKFQLLLTMLLICALPLCTACSWDDDDDEDDAEPANTSTSDYTLPSSGSITVTNEDGSTYTREVSDAGFRLHAYDRDDPPRLDFKVTFKNEGSTSDESILVNNRRISNITFHKDSVYSYQTGTIATSGQVRANYFVSAGREYDWQYIHGYFFGDASITAYDLNKTITVRFTDCEFSLSSTDNHGKASGTFSGEITFALRSMDFFE